MAMYYCHHCGHYIDNDYHPGEEDPEDKLQLICPNCLDNLQDEEDNQPSESQEWFDYDPDC